MSSNTQIKTRADEPRDRESHPAGWNSFHGSSKGCQAPPERRHGSVTDWASLTYTSCSITIHPVKRKNMGLNYSQMDALMDPPWQQQRDTKRAAPEPEARRPETSEDWLERSRRTSEGFRFCLQFKDVCVHGVTLHSLNSVCLFDVYSSSHLPICS